MPSLKQKCRHFDEIFITGYTGSCHFDNFQCSQWWQFHQNEGLSVSVIEAILTDFGRIGRYKIQRNTTVWANCIIIHPSSKFMADFFSDTKINMMPSPNLYDFWWVRKMHASGVFMRKINWRFCINPLCSEGLNALSVFVLFCFCFCFKSSLNIIVYPLVKFYGFKWNFLNFKVDKLPYSPLNFMAIWFTVTKPSVNKYRSLCELISNSMHVNLAQVSERIVVKLRFHRLDWVLLL